AAVFISGIALVLWLFNSWRTSRLLKKYKAMMQGMEGKDLETMLTAHLDAVNKALGKTREVESAYKAVRKMAERSIQHVGVVRFNAFSDTGSDLSFSIALLDHNGDGLVLSSIFSRNESHAYAKPVSKGASSYHLSGEEEAAIRKALENEIIR
ncbi:MAG: DUF4446 family protein, partial [Eubacteriales bacterium]